MSPLVDTVLDPSARFRVRYLRPVIAASGSAICDKLLRHFDRGIEEGVMV